VIYFFILMFAQVVLEVFPVSSSGQVALLEKIFFLIKKDACFSLASNNVISHFLHGPTMIVVALFFFDRWFFLLLHVRRCWKILLKLFVFVFAADVVTFFFFLLCNTFFNKTLFLVGVGFVISAVALFSLLFCSTGKSGSVTFSKAILLGAVQGISLLPGISRLGATFAAGCWLGISPRRSFEFSFAMQWPLITVGFFNSLRFMCSPFFYAYNNLFSLDVLMLLVTASVISFFGLGFMQRLVLEKKTWIFSIIVMFSFVAWMLLPFL